MHPVLQLYEDVLSDNAKVALSACARMIFVVHGNLTIDGRTVRDGETWHGEGNVSLTAGASGVTYWRWEFVADATTAAAAAGATASHEKLSAALTMLPAGELLLRGDSVAFPPDGCAYLHRHQGPGIRCLIEGGIRIDTHGRSTSLGPGGAWYESGPDAVFAQAARDKPSRFIRVMILPRELQGKGSIQYVNDDDKARPKSQQYKIYADAPISFE